MNGISPLPGIVSSTLNLPATPDVSDELGRAGASLGSLVEVTGTAVANTQSQLTATSAATATTLANTLVDVIAVQETVYDDQGNIRDGNTYVRRLPLINFVDPVFYEWTQVRLQGQFFAEELASASHQETSSGSETRSGGEAGLRIILGVRYETSARQSEATSWGTTATSDVSFGRLRMYAQLNPKRDIGVPKPRQVVQGPSLAIIEGEITDIFDEEEGKLVARTASAMIELRKRDGSPIPNKLLSIETDRAAWSFSGDQQTDANGRVSILLRREFLGEAPDTSPVGVIVTARLGMVANSTAINF